METVVAVVCLRSYGEQRDEFLVDSLGQRSEIRARPVIDSGSNVDKAVRVICQAVKRGELQRKAAHTPCKGRYSRGQERLIHRRNRKWASERYVMALAQEPMDRRGPEAASSVPPISDAGGLTEHSVQ